MVGPLVHFLGDKNVSATENPTASEKSQNPFFIPQAYYTLSMIFQSVVGHINNNPGTVYAISEMHKYFDHSLQEVVSQALFAISVSQTI